VGDGGGAGSGAEADAGFGVGLGAGLCACAGLVRGAGSSPERLRAGRRWRCSGRRRIRWGAFLALCDGNAPRGGEVTRGNPTSLPSGGGSGARSRPGNTANATTTETAAPTTFATPCHRTLSARTGTQGPAAR